MSELLSVTYFSSNSIAEVQTRSIFRNHQSKQSQLHCVLLISGVRVDDDIVRNVWMKTAILIGSPCFSQKLPNVGIKVKGALVQALRLCTGRMSYRSRGIALPFHDHGTRRG